MKALEPTWAGHISVQGVRYWRVNGDSRVQCSRNSTTGKEKLKVQVWEMKNNTDASISYHGPQGV